MRPLSTCLISFNHTLQPDNYNASDTCTFDTPSANTKTSSERLLSQSWQPPVLGYQIYVQDYRFWNCLSGRRGGDDPGAHSHMYMHIYISGTSITHTNSYGQNLLSHCACTQTHTFLMPACTLFNLITPVFTGISYKWCMNHIQTPAVYLLYALFS